MCTQACVGFKVLKAAWIAATGSNYLSVEGLQFMLPSIPMGAAIYVCKPPPPLTPP